MVRERSTAVGDRLGVPVQADDAVESIDFPEELPFLSPGELRDLRYRTFESMLP